jgi:hypothetical protein
VGFWNGIFSAAALSARISPRLVEARWIRRAKSWSTSRMAGERLRIAGFDQRTAAAADGAVGEG